MQPLALLQARDHVVEGAREPPGLVSRDDRHARAQVAAATRSVASRSASSGPKIERDSSIVSSSEIVKATITATTTAGPRSDSCAPCG